MTELIAAVIRMNLAAAAAVLAVAALRPLFRRAYGAEVAYGLWLAPPLAALGSLVPPRIDSSAEALAGQPALPPAALPWLVAAWGLGAAAMVLLFLIEHRRFAAQARTGAAGAAVIGVIVPRIVMPPDDGRYSPEERALMRSHEREHIARGDPRANAWMAACQCLAWFNPLVHLGVALARLDQELACDAAILRRNRSARGLYARTLLKAQMLEAPPALVSCWAAGGRHPLELRLAAMVRSGSGDGDAGPLLVTGLAAMAGLFAWCAQPPAPPPPSSIIWVPVEVHHPDMQVLLIRPSSPPQPAAHDPA
jgi:beta-lactamase regulating signal transducer with metallopeptidase domain